MSSAPSNFSREFTITKIGNSDGADTTLEYVHSIETKLLYLRMELTKLEKAQIAESIMQVESIPGNQSRYLVTFDSNILNQKMDMSIEELSSLNKLREYSLFGIHRTMPNSPIPCFSYFKDFHIVCRDPDFKFEDTMPYNQDPLKYLAAQSGKKKSNQTAKKCEELFMCHHCKVLLPPESIFTCSKKFKCLQSEPCTLFSSRGFPEEVYHGLQDANATIMQQDLLPLLHQQLVQLQAREQNLMSSMSGTVLLHPMRATRQYRSLLSDLRATRRQHR